jgi:hypothetical protein
MSFFVTNHLQATATNNIFDDLWEHNISKPNYERLFIKDNKAFLKEETKEDTLDDLFTRNTRPSNHKTRKVISIDHKGETLKIKK